MSIEVEPLNASKMQVELRTFLRLASFDDTHCWYVYVEEGWRRVALAYSLQKADELEALWQKESL